MARPAAKGAGYRRNAAGGDYDLRQHGTSGLAHIDAKA